VAVCADTIEKLNVKAHNSERDKKSAKLPS